LKVTATKIQQHSLESPSGQALRAKIEAIVVLHLQHTRKDKQMAKTVAETIILQ
jgi:hypothetical protein